MASDYGLNFGFRRSDESVLVREGRLKVPVSGTFLLGSQVEFDPNNPGYLMVSPSGSTPSAGGYVGLLVQEEIWDRSIYAPTRIDSFYYGVARNNRLGVICSGPGGKVWYKNTAAQTRADGRQIAAVTMVDLSGVGIGSYLKWSGTEWVAGTGPSDSLLRVTLTNGSDYVEADLIH